MTPLSFLLSTGIGRTKMLTISMVVSSAFALLTLLTITSRAIPLKSSIEQHQYSSAGVYDDSQFYPRFPSAILSSSTTTTNIQIATTITTTTSTGNFSHSVLMAKNDTGSDQPIDSSPFQSISTSQQQSHPKPPTATKVSHQQQQKKHDWNTTKELVRPDNDNTAIALVTMGGASRTWITERCIHSIRFGGNFSGPILVFTDEEGYERHINRSTVSLSQHHQYQYQQSSVRENHYDHPKVYIIQGRPEDLIPRTEDGKEVKYRHHKLVYKRFKTLTSTYLGLKGGDYRISDSSLDSSTIRYVLYLDIDNVVTKPLSGLFDDYHSNIKDHYLVTLQNITAENREQQQQGDQQHIDIDNNQHPFSFVSMWRDPGLKHRPWQGGQLLLDRQYSSGCEDAWRNEMDTTTEFGMDQPLMMNVVNNFSKYKCIVFELPGGGRDGHHFDLLRVDMIKKMNKQRKKPQQHGDYPTIIHITSARFKKFSTTTHQAFVRTILHLDGINNNNYTATTNNNTSITQQQAQQGYYEKLTMPFSADGRMRNDDKTNDNYDSFLPPSQERGRRRKRRKKKTMAVVAESEVIGTHEGD
jgi:hypothetical protein